MTNIHPNADDLWAREGGSEITNLVELLAEVAGIHDFSGAGGDVVETADLAATLKEPVYDWQGPARSAGWVLDASSLTPGGCYKRDHGEIHEAANWAAACKLEGMQPDCHAVSGHWIVSKWLADQLIEHGERVTRNFTGLAVWSRTSSGPSITQDPVLQQIAHETAKAAPAVAEDPAP